MIYENPLLEKSLHFASCIFKLYQYLSQEKHESIILRQIIRCWTSIGANANEAVYGVSQADFIAKLQISLKETAETEYWLRLLRLSEYIGEKSRSVDEMLDQSVSFICLILIRIYAYIVYIHTVYQFYWMLILPSLRILPCQLMIFFLRLFCLCKSGIPVAWII